MQLLICVVCVVKGRAAKSAEQKSARCCLEGSTARLESRRATPCRSVDGIAAGSAFLQDEDAASMKEKSEAAQCDVERVHRRPRRTGGGDGGRTMGCDASHRRESG